MAVVGWLDSLRRCAAALERVTSAMRELGERDGVCGVRYGASAPRRHNADQVGRLLVENEERAEQLRQERECLKPVVDSCLRFLVFAQQEGSDPSAYTYLLHYYGKAEPRAMASKAAGLDQWEARLVPRMIAPELYALDPGRFDKPMHSWGRYGYWEFAADTGGADAEQ